MTDPLTNPISYLQEHSQKLKKNFPDYKEQVPTGPDHCQKFSVLCLFEGRTTQGSGYSKKSAKTNAALEMVQLLKNDPTFNELLSSVHQTEKNGTTAGSMNPISALMEYCAKEKIERPLYFETSAGSSGFISECQLNDKKTFGQGRTKKSAKAESSAKMCEEYNIPFAIESKANHTTDNSLCENRNYIFQLQDYINTYHLKEPVYHELNLVNNMFEVTCSVGHFSGQGVDLTKEEAKNLAACEVLNKLSRHTSQVENGDESTSIKNLLLSSDLSSERASSKDTVCAPLQEMVREDDESILETNSTGNIIANLESLILDDSVVEVEPSTIKK